MFQFPPTLILRHRRENLKKCSLTGLEGRPDMRFFTYPDAQLPDLSNYILLTLGAPPLSCADSHLGIVLVDGTWRYAEKMVQSLYVAEATKRPQKALERSLPPLCTTAYPRKPNPEGGLASVEALFYAYKILGRTTDGILDHYYFRENFLNNFPNRLFP